MLRIAAVFALLLQAVARAQYVFDRSFFSSSFDEPTSVVNSMDEKLQRLEEKLTTYFKQQLSLLRERVENLERNVQELKRVNTLDWNTTDSGSLYKIFTGKKSWDEAQSMCKSYGGQLAVIDNDRKNAYATELLNQQFPPNDSATVAEDKGLGVWIGLKTKAEMSSTSSRYSNFYEGEKVDGCTMIDRLGKWKIHSCRTPASFLCQIVSVR